jgi:hypothetical protein
MIGSSRGFGTGGLGADDDRATCRPPPDYPRKPVKGKRRAGVTWG